MLRIVVLAKVFIIPSYVTLQVDFEGSTGVKFPMVLLIEPLADNPQPFPAVDLLLIPTQVDLLPKIPMPLET